MSTREERLAAISREREAEQDAARNRHTRVRARLPEVLVPVFELHGPQDSTWPPWVTCNGCDPGERAESNAEWPCSTWELIAGEEPGTVDGAALAGAETGMMGGVPERFRCPICRVIYFNGRAECVGGWPVYDPARPGAFDPPHDPTPVAPDRTDVHQDAR